MWQPCLVLKWLQEVACKADRAVARRETSLRYRSLERVSARGAWNQAGGKLHVTINAPTAAEGRP